MEKYTFAGLCLQLSLMLISVNADPSKNDINATLSDNSTVFLGQSGFPPKNYKVKGYAEFFGIRYAQPPVGDRRFQRVSMYEYKEKAVPAKTHGNVCVQKRKDNALVADTDVIGEDCLYLNIIVPLDKEVQDVSTIAEKKAVYIFIHGGVFVRGSSNLYVTTDLVMRGDFIAVTINYRLGVLGFLTTDDGVMPANLGLWDQQLAIRWVKENIESFGGDASRITVGGQSAGSMSAILHGFYKGNDYLFQNIIGESGSPFASTVIAEKGLALTLEVAEMAQCDVTSKKGVELSKEVLKCLRGKSETEIANLPDPKGQIGPVLDLDFIDRKTFELCPQGLPQMLHPKSVSPVFARKNLLTGFTSNDGEIMLSLVLEKLVNAFKITDRANFVKAPISPQVLRILLSNYMLTDKTEDIKTKRVIVDAIMENYVDWSHPSNKVAASMGAVNIMTDYFFVSPAMETALLHSQANTCGRLKLSNCGKETKSTYVYEFHYPRDTVLAINGDFPWFQGTRHGAELFLFTDIPLKLQYPELTERLFTSWTNFIKTGNPNSGDSEDWKKFNENSKDIYLLTHESKLENGTHAKKVHFWTEYLPKLQDRFRSLLVAPRIENTPCKGEHDNNVGARLSNEKYVVSFIALSVLAYLKF